MSSHHRPPDKEAVGEVDYVTAEGIVGLWPGLQYGGIVGMLSGAGVFACAEVLGSESATVVLKKMDQKSLTVAALNCCKSEFVLRGMDGKSSAGSFMNG